MKLLDNTSLRQTVDHFNEAALFALPIDPAEKAPAARWIASRLHQPGGYRGLPAPTAEETRQKPFTTYTFTGEHLTNASARHILGQEAARVLTLLGMDEPGIVNAYHAATVWMEELPESFDQWGLFCCGKCTLAYWRHVLAGRFPRSEELIQRGLGTLRNARDGNGKWGRFPYYYTIYTLSGLEFPGALEELRYSLPVMERLSKRKLSGEYAPRREAILTQAIEKVS